MPIVAVLMVLVLGTVAPACVAGWPVNRGFSCRQEKIGRACARQKAATHIQNQQDKRCGLRGFLQLHFVSLSRDDRFTPQVKSVEYIRPATPALIVSSVGPPETDRGPPNS